MHAPSAFTYKAFLSYSHADTKTAVWLHKRLESFPLRGLAGRETALGPVPASLRPIFRDREDFTAGHSLSDQTVAALDASAALIVLCSPASAKSHYVNEEVRLFKSRHPGRPVIPVIADGVPGDPSRECFAPALRFELDADGAVTDRPLQLLAADLREAGDGRELALAKVVAALIGVPSDEVYRRAERVRRRQGRIRGAIAAVILALAGSAGFFVYRSQQRGAVIIDTAAKCASRIPVSQASVGPLNALESCIKAMELIQKGAATDPRDAETVNLINAGKREEAERLQLEAARDDEAAGIANNKKAAERYRGLAATAGLADPKKAREYYAKAAKLDPENIAGMGWHAYMQKDAGNLAEAERAYNAVLAAGIKGKDDRDLYWAGLGRGDILVARGNLAEAQKTYRDAAADADRLAKADPGNAGWQRDLSVSYDSVGDVLKEQGNLPEALKSYQASLAIADRLAKADPGNAGWQRDVYASLWYVADVKISQGDLNSALADLRRGQDIMERLAKADPGNAGWQRDLSVSYDRVGDVLKAQGNLPEALKSFQASLAIADRLAKADPGNAGWQRDLSVTHEDVGDVLAVQGNLAEALTSYRASLAIRDRLANADPGNAGWQADLAASYGKLGLLYVRMGDKVEARRMFERGRAILAPFAEKSGHQLWIGNLSSFDKQLAALDQAAITDAFEAGDYAKAAALQSELAEAREKAETAQSGAPGANTAQQLGLVSWHRLFTREYGAALAAAERALKLAPDKLWIATNRAHALMFLGRAEEARAAYLEHKGQTIEGQGLWDEVIAKDFAEFEKRGLTHPQMAEIRRLLAPAAPPQK